MDSEPQSESTQSNIPPPENGENGIILREKRLQGYNDWVLSLLDQVQQNKLSPEQIAAIISRSLLARDIQAERHYIKARQDSLTRLPNRNAFHEIIRQAQERFTAEGLPFGLLLLDIDHFKKFNDTYGHNAGDQVLVQTALRIASSIRQRPLRSLGKIHGNNANNTDIAVRYGGEEFAVLLFGVDNDRGIEAVGNRILHAFRETPFVIKSEKEPQRVNVTTSIGGGIYAGQEIAEFIGIIDQGLYKAKESGRNQLVVIPSSQSS